MEASSPATRRFWSRCPRRWISASPGWGGRGESEAATCPKWPRGLGFSALKRTRTPFVSIGPWPIYKSHKTVSTGPGGPSPSLQLATPLLFSAVARETAAQGEWRGEAPATGSQPAVSSETIRVLGVKQCAPYFCHF